MMLTVNQNVNPFVNVRPLSSVQNVRQSADVNDIQSVPVFFDEGDRSGVSVPVLVSPVVGLSVKDVRGTTEFLKKAGEDMMSLNVVERAFITKANEEMQRCMEEKRTENGGFFDISHMSSGAVALLVAANMLMLSLNQADTRLASKLSLVSFDAAKNIADSMKREGTGILTGNISQSVLQLGLTGVGAKYGLKGLKNEKLALQQDTMKLQKSTGNVLGAGSQTGLDIKDNLSMTARRQAMTGDAIMRNSSAVGSIAGSSGQYVSTLERSEQQVSQANNRVAGTASEDVRESAHKANNLIQEILKIMGNISQSKMATMAAVAGNIRA